MAILLWLVIGLIAGVAAHVLAGSRKNRFVVDLTVGLVASLVGGILFLAFR